MGCGSSNGLVQVAPIQHRLDQGETTYYAAANINRNSSPFDHSRQQNQYQQYHQHHHHNQNEYQHYQPQQMYQHFPPSYQEVQQQHQQQALLTYQPYQQQIQQQQQSHRKQVQQQQQVQHQQHGNQDQQQRQMRHPQMLTQHATMTNENESLNAVTYCTAKDVLERNTETGAVVWGIYKKKIYNIPGVMQYFRPQMRDAVNNMTPGSRRYIYAVNAQYYTGQLGNFMTHLLQYGIPKESIQEVIDNFCVGYLKIPTAAEFETEYKKEIYAMINRLNEDSGASQTEKDLLLVCKRTLQLLGNGESIAITGIDPNGKAFPLPDDFGYFSPECLREWCWNDSYEPFETSEEPWYAYEKTEDPLPELLGSTEVYCNWLNDWEPFDFEIEGEAAWEILPTNVIQNDELTPEQIEIIKFREQRSDLTDPVRMANRRKRLAKYFMEKYNWDESHLKPYEGWAERLQENENMLAELSQLS